MSTENVVLDEFHLHELMDRLHCMQTMFDTLVFEHPAAVLLIDDLTEVQQSLGIAYQKAALLRFEDSTPPETT